MFSTFKTGGIILFVSAGLLFGMSSLLARQETPSNTVKAGMSTESVNWFNRLSRIPIKG